MRDSLQSSRQSPVGELYRLDRRIDDLETSVDLRRVLEEICEDDISFQRSRRPILVQISRMQYSMRKLLSRVVICSAQCKRLISEIQCLSDGILDLLRARGYWELSPSPSHYWEPVSALLDRFICNMVAAVDLLHLCAEVDWTLAAFTVFPPAYCDPSHSKFALVARDLDETNFKLRSLLMPAMFIPRIGPVSRGLRVASNQDRSSVLHKLESRPSKRTLPRQMYESFRRSRGSFQRKMFAIDSLLRRRCQVDASAFTPGSLPGWCWIPVEKLEYSIVGVAGLGSSKSVLKCQWLGMDVAISVYKGGNAERELETEAGILASVQHPNVVSLFACAYDSGLEEGHLVTELMEQDLSQLITKRKASQGDGEMPCSLSVSKDIILQIVEGMIHMRKCRVLHRDLKPANILVSAKKCIWQDNWGQPYYVVKLIDFGSAKVRGPDASTCHTRKQGTTAYMAPELHALPDECAYKWSADVYSLGMTMYEILSGRFPFEGVCTGGELVRRVCAGERPSFPECIPGMWRELIKNCWHQVPEQRYDFERIKNEVMGIITI